MPTPLQDLRDAVDRAAASLGAEPKAPPTLERPKQADHGDYATNAALLLAGALKAKPRDVAERLASAVQGELGPALERVDVAGPGFLNLVLTDAWYAAALADVLEAGDAFGAGTAREPLKVNVEFVSANPTGPVHVGHARNAAFGDAVARILAHVGHDVFREFYVNDFGTQVLRLGESVQARARGEEVPEGGYRGDYVRDLAERIPGAASAPVEEVAKQAVALMVDLNRRSLEAFRVTFDRWFSERSLHEPAPGGGPSPVQHGFDVLAEQGRSYRHEGALWLRTTEFGDDKDRVIERASGDHTYFASDIAYHQDKRERGFDLLLDVWGADHHGYVDRMHAAFEALGGRPDGLELLIMQFVKLAGGGSMSKRAGEFVTLDELVADIGVDAARWFLLQRSHETTIELDLDLAKSQSSDNPVYYVQYAHARIAAILRKAAAEDAAAPSAELPATHSLHPSERALVKALLAFPAEIAEAADRRAPHRVATYVLDLAQTFTAFYRDCQVVGAGEAEAFRVALCVASRQVLARGLDLLGVSAPDEM
jgi:arginyl-tRNA synthetase